MVSRAVFGRHFARQSNQPLRRNKPWLDNQTFRVCRGVQVPTVGQRKSGFLPAPTHWKPATCEEVDCPFYVNGWQTVIDLTPMQDQQQLQERKYASEYLHKSGWDFRVEWDGSKEIFHFAPGQNHYPKIARDHRHLMPVERDPVFLHTNPWGGFRQLDYDEYFDKFNETTYQLGKRFKEG